MTNEFGVQLDRAGYAPSVMQMQRRTSCCYLCGRATGWNKLDRHEPWGAANRRKSMELGLWVLLCHEGCHEGPGSVHADGAKARELRKDAQRAAMLRYGWTREEWIARFGKSELSEDECRRLIVIPKAVREKAEGANTSSGPAGHLPLEGKARGAGEDPSTPLRSAQDDKRESAQDDKRESAQDDRRGAGTRRRVTAMIAELWPDHNTTTRGAFQLLPDDPDLPF